MIASRCAHRLLVDVLDDVGVDRRARLGHRQQVGPGAGAAGDLGRAAARSRCRGCSRRTSRRSATAAGSRRWRWRGTGGTAELLICDRDRGLVQRSRSARAAAHACTRPSSDRSDGRAGDPHVLARHRERGVVEDRADLVRIAAASRRRRSRRSRATATATSDERDQRDPSHGPGGVELGSQPGTGHGRRAVGRRLDGATGAAARTTWQALVAVRRRLRRELVEPFDREREEHRLDPHVVAVGVVVAAAPGRRS